MSSKKTHPWLIWVDCEMTGLNPQTEKILEIAVVITDENLDVMAEMPSLVIHHKLKRLEQMDEWNRSHHAASGLWQKSMESTLTIKNAEEQILAFLEKNLLQSEFVNMRPPLAGNSVGQDKAFLDLEMPKLMEKLHYRIIDVSSIKEMALRWYPQIEAFEKAEKHRALDDIHESINELKYFRQLIFK
jgi:oligoribonuclease